MSVGVVCAQAVLVLGASPRLSVANELAVAIRGESFRAIIADVDTMTLQSEASRTHAAMLSVLCGHSARWRCALTLYTYSRQAGNSSSDIGDATAGALRRYYSEFEPVVRLLPYFSGDRSSWWVPALEEHWHTSFALLDFRFDMVFKDPAALGAQLLQAVALAADDVQPSALTRAASLVLHPVGLLVPFRIASHLRLNLIKDGPRLGETYRMRLRCTHVTRRGRPRVADTLHLTPRRLFGLARTGFLSEDIADRLSKPHQLRWLSDELADSDTWKCSNSIYTLNSRPSNRSLTPQFITGVTEGAPSKNELRLHALQHQASIICPNYSYAWWPELGPTVTKKNF